jgi:hypothetical protein
MERRKMNNWGEPDEVDFPDWMLPDNHPQKMRKMPVRQAKSLTETIAEVLKTPVIDRSPEDLLKKTLNEDI